MNNAFCAYREQHDDFATCVGWITSDEVMSCGDDRRLIFWNAVTHEQIKSVDLPSELFVTDLDSLPRASKQKQGEGLLVIGTTDGRFHLLNRAGKLTKSVDAHVGAVLSLRWSPNSGSALATAGEDGHVKIWSSNGMLRSTLDILSTPVHCISWSGSSTHVVYTVGYKLQIKSLSPNSKPINWKAHDGIVLNVAWNNDLIISGGEDCKYKVWDSLGRMLYTSCTHDYPITSLSWSPDGSLFAVGSFNMLKLCDHTGWSCSLDKPTVHSLACIAWSADSSQVVASCGSGSTVFAHVIEKKIEWKSYEIIATGRRCIRVQNVLTNVQEELDFRDNVIKFSMEFGYLIALTASQCYIYRTTNWNTPHIFDLKEQNVTLLLQCDKHFLLVDGNSVSLYLYEGRFLLSVKWLGMRVESLNKSSISLSSDTIAVINANDAKHIHFIDVSTGKELTGNNGGQAYKHKLEITEIAIDCRGTAKERKCAFIDKNADLYLVLVRGLSSSPSMLQTVKLAAMVKCMKWNEDANILAAFQENNKLLIWIYPQVAFIDRELLSASCYEKDSSEFGSKNLQLIGFQDNEITVRRSDGSLVSSAINPFATLLHTYTSQTHWSEALRLCRYSRDKSPESGNVIFAAFAGMALNGRQIELAEEAYSAIDRVEKVFALQHVQTLGSKEAKSAEIALICGNFREAESICLQAGFVLRAILINVQLHKWVRAAQLATKYDTKYLQVVLAHRQRFLERFSRTENNAQLQALFEEVSMCECPFGRH